MDFLFPLFISFITIFLAFYRWKRKYRGEKKYRWKKKPGRKFDFLLNALLILAPLPFWVQFSGYEFGTTYYFIALSLTGLALTIYHRDRSALKLAIKQRRVNTSDSAIKETIQRRLKKSIQVILTIGIASALGVLLLFSATRLTDATSSNALIGLSVITLLVTPLLFTSFRLIGFNLQPRVPGFIHQNLNAHKLLGVVSAALLYLVCLSGTFSVFYEEFERLEQPDVEEYAVFEPTLIEPALQEYQQRLQRTPASIYIVLPTPDFPRTHITDGVDEWYLNSDGQFAQQPHVPWTEMIKALHTNLHLPYNLGMTLVGITGLLLTALIISGVVAHPTLFRDAFLLRKKKSRRQQQTDLHNRLAVWALPFHLMIALTGAFIGLSNDFFNVMASAQFDGDGQADSGVIVEAIYGDDPTLLSKGETINYVAAFQQLKTDVPNATPIYMVVHQLGQPEQLLEIAARLPGRFSYSEMYRFNTQGELVGHQGLTDGPVGRQLAYSTYRIHFGHFDGLWVKGLYGLLGLSLTLVCVFGMNIWFARRGEQGLLHYLWQGWVWATPVMLLLCYPLSLLGQLFSTTVPFSLTTLFWSGVLLVILLNLIRKR